MIVRVQYGRLAVTDASPESKEETNDRTTEVKGL